MRERGRGMSCINRGDKKGGEESCEEKIDRGIHRGDRILLDSEDSATMKGPLVGI
jgi:hypothetical protein